MGAGDENSGITTFVSHGLADTVTSLRVLANERGEEAPKENEVRDALATALGACRGPGGRANCGELHRLPYVVKDFSRAELAGVSDPVAG